MNITKTKIIHRGIDYAVHLSTPFGYYEKRSHLFSHSVIRYLTKLFRKQFHKFQILCYYAEVEMQYLNRL